VTGWTGCSDDGNRDRPYSPVPTWLIVAAAAIIATTY
jgi:hypothetical protein